MTPFDKWLAVVLATLNPLTGRSVSIPLGLGLGLPLVSVSAAAAVSNFALALALILFIERLERFPRIHAYLEKKRGKTLTRFIQGRGLLYSVILGPLALGTFTVVLVFQALGADKKRMALYSLLSAVLVTAVIAWMSPFMLRLMKQYVAFLKPFFSGYAKA